jgi:hypothetical protein
MISMLAVEAERVLQFPFSPVQYESIFLRHADYNVNSSQLLNIRVSEASVTTENKNVAHGREALCWKISKQ